MPAAQQCAPNAGNRKAGRPKGASPTRPAGSGALSSQWRAADWPWPSAPFGGLSPPRRRPCAPGGPLSRLFGARSQQAARAPHSNLPINHEPLPAGLPAPTCGASLGLALARQGRPNGRPTLGPNSKAGQGIMCIRDCGLAELGWAGLSLGCVRVSAIRRGRSLAARR